MSRYEKHKGTLKLIWQCDEVFDLSKQLKGALDDFEYDRMMECVDEDYSVDEYIRDELYDNYILINNALFKIEDLELDEDEDLNIFEKVNDHTYTYLNSFYNGGTCLSELLEDNLSKIL